MKRALALGLLLLIALGCVAQPADVDQIYAADTPRTIVWNAVTTDADGDPLLPGDVIEYRVYVTLSPFGSYSTVLVADEVLLTEATLDLSAMPRGYYYVGVSAYDASVPGVPGEESGIAWSNDPDAVDPTQRFSWLVTGTLFPADPSGLETVP